MEMYLAVAMIVLLVAGLVAGLVTGMIIILRHGMVGFLVVRLVNVVVLGLGLFHKGAEDKARSLRTTGSLEAEYRRISHTWNKKALPDFRAFGGWSGNRRVARGALRGRRRPGGDRGPRHVIPYVDTSRLWATYHAP